MEEQFMGNAYDKDENWIMDIYKMTDGNYRLSGVIKPDALDEESGIISVTMEMIVTAEEMKEINEQYDFGLEL